MQRAAIAIIVAAIFAAPANVSSNTARKPAGSELELLFGAIRAEPQKASEPEQPFTRFASMEDICTTLETAATAHDLPVPFFVRLIWQESRFRPYAVSRAGAKGIAQFMPATARERGLTDPLDPIAALHESAAFLRDLRNQFGNLGLAAAAYNGGPGRVQAWLNGRGGLPTETRQYVHIVTGSPADRWRGKDATAVQTSQIPVQVPCPALVALAAAREDITGQVPLQRAAAEVARRAGRDKSSGWSVMLAGTFTPDKAQKRSAMVARKFRAVLNGRRPTVVKGRAAGRGRAHMSHVRITETDRATAEKLCARLRAGGTGCVVTRES